MVQRICPALPWVRITTSVSTDDEDLAGGDEGPDLEVNFLIIVPPSCVPLTSAFDSAVTVDSFGFPTSCPSIGFLAANASTWEGVNHVLLLSELLNTFEDCR